MIRQLLKLTLLALVAATTHCAFAVKYNLASEDLLLVIRNGTTKDMVWDVGSVSNILAVAPGNTVTVTNYKPSSVITTFGSYGAAGLDFALVATSSDVDPNSRIWVTVADPAATPAQLTGNDWSTLFGKASAVGTYASSHSAYSTTTNYVVAPTSAFSYSFNVSPSDINNVPNWEGNFAYSVESAVGTTQNFYQLSTTGTGKLLGTFTMDGATGAVTFTAASAGVTLVPARITDITRASGISHISFTTTTGNNYQLLYSTNLANWQTNVAAGTVLGDTTVKTLNDTTADPKRFYRIQSF